MRRVFALVLFALWGCGPSLQLEAGGTAAVEPWFRVEAPLAPAAPALPKLTPCPAGWREEAGDVSTCEPWPETGRAPCAGESVHRRCPAVARAFNITDRGFTRTWVKSVVIGRPGPQTNGAPRSG